MADTRYLATYEKVNRLLLLLYVATTPFASVKIAPEVSFSFAVAVAFFAAKATMQVVVYRHVLYQPECVTVCLVLVYLLGAESLIHQGDVVGQHFITFTLNVIMMIALVDEFKRAPFVRDAAILVFSLVVTVMAMLMLLGWGAAVSQAGRITFLGLNENEMAYSCLIAFTPFALFLRDHLKENAALQIVAYAATVLLILALVSTGTRFTYVVLILQIFVLLTSDALQKRVAWRGVAIAASWLFAVTLFTSQSETMIKRLDPTVGLDRATASPSKQLESTGSPPAASRKSDSGFAVFGDSSSVVDLGGRSTMWVEAVQAMQESPVFGLGYTGYEEYQHRTRTYFSMPHNFVLEIAAIGGLVGLGIIAILVFQLARRIYWGWKRTRTLNALSWALVLMAPAAFLNITHMKVFWFLLGYFITHAVSRRTAAGPPTAA